MEKPLTVARQEFVENLIKTINEAQLPAFVVAGVLKDTLEEVQKVAQNQYLAEKQAWEEKEAEE